MGVQLSPDVARLIARGDIDPNTHEPFEGFVSEQAGANNISAKPGSNIETSANLIRRPALERAEPNKLFQARNQQIITSMFRRCDSSKDAQLSGRSTSPQISLTVSADAARDFKKPRLAQNIGSTENDPAYTESSENAESPACDNIEGDNHQSSNSQRPRGWTANPFATKTPRSVEIGNAQTMEIVSKRPALKGKFGSNGVTVTSKFFESSRQNSSKVPTVEDDNSTSSVSEHSAGGMNSGSKCFDNDLDRFAFAPRPEPHTRMSLEISNGLELKSDNECGPRFSSHMTRIASSMTSRLTVRPSLPSSRTISATRPASDLDLLAYRRR
mmetsp:Transcript_20238/g.56060  ORF Transcript_20238/g.56060 Transcript_20238/m.56060 type:complete len:328 (+) Transcript_20238:1122-2105(+)